MTKEPIPVFLHREFIDIVAAVSAKLTAQLKTIDPNITGVHYQYGHPLEIIKTIGHFDSGVASKFKKYPLVAFFLDSTVDRTDSQFYGEQSINMAIIRACKDPNQTAAERDEFNFIPVLTPIYVELLNQIRLRGDLFTGVSQGLIPHRYTNRYYWGKTGLFGNDGNIFNDWFDAVEINNLKLKINTNYCPRVV